MGPPMAGGGQLMQGPQVGATSRKQVARLEALLQVSVGSWHNWRVLVPSLSGLCGRQPFGGLLAGRAYVETYTKVDP